MKTTALIIALLLGLASCHIRFFEASDSVSDDVGDKRDEVIDFLNGLFDTFKLPSPTQMIKCFNNVNAGLYYSLIQEMSKLFEDTKERNSFQLHIELVKLGILNQSLKQSHACIMVTQDFTDIIQALGINKRDPEEFGMILYLYYQSHYLDLFEGFKPIIDNLNTASNYAAGEAFGVVLSEMVNTVKEEGTYHMAFAAFGNGAAITLDVDEPNDSLQCYDKNSSRLYLEFTYKLALAVAEGSIKEAPINVYKFWDREGKDIMAQIPTSVFDCEAQSNDIQNINRKLGLDVTTKEFGERMLKYINNNRFSYYALCKSMKGALEHHNFHHAGSVHGHLLKAIADHTL